MSEPIKHECGIALIRLLKPLSYYQEKYGTPFYGLNKLYLLMEKQHNRGQDGAGIATIKLDTEPGYPFLYRLRSNAHQPIADLFDKVAKEIEEIEKQQPDIKQHPGLMKGHINVLGELLLGHLRYGTQGRNDINFCHPFIKKDIIPARNLALAGNFNLVNTEELFDKIGIAPDAFSKQSDLAAMMEVLHHFLVAEDEQTPDNANILNALKKQIYLCRHILTSMK
jgi:amidophosphoribosyltransferase